MNEKDMIKVIDARLHYLFSSQEKNNTEEVNALINLLKEYDPDASKNNRGIHIAKGYSQNPEIITALIAVTAYITILAVIVLLESN